MRLSFFLFLFPMLAAAQVFTSTVKSSDDQTPLAYVNVSILNKKIGTNTNSKGEFSLALQKYKQDTLLISHIGYESKKLTIITLLKHPEHYQNLFMNSAYEAIDEVVLQVKNKKYGGKHSLGLRKKWFSSRVGVQFGMEQAIYIPNDKDKPGKVEEVSFWVGEEDQMFYNSRFTWFRIKFYNYDKLNQEPGKLLSYETLLIKPEGNTEQHLKIEVSKYAIPFPKNGICVVIETINPNPTEGSDNQYMTYPTLIYSREKVNRSWMNYRGNNWHQRSEEHRVENAVLGNDKKMYLTPVVKIKVRYEK